MEPLTAAKKVIDRVEANGGVMTNEQIHELAQRLRIDSVRAAAAASSGHPTSAMSAADAMAVPDGAVPALQL